MSPSEIGMNPQRGCAGLHHHEHGGLPQQPAPGRDLHLDDGRRGLGLPNPHHRLQPRPHTLQTQVVTGSGPTSVNYLLRDCPWNSTIHKF